MVDFTPKSPIRYHVQLMDSCGAVRSSNVTGQDMSLADADAVCRYLTRQGLLTERGDTFIVTPTEESVAAAYKLELWALFRCVTGEDDGDAVAFIKALRHVADDIAARVEASSSTNHTQSPRRPRSL